MTAEDTIAAVATPPGSGGVGIVRLSGPAAGGIVARLLGRDEGALAERRMVLGVARDPATGERLDEVLAVLMRGPRSYTGEDVAEVHAHGGALNLARLLRAALACGARPAEPGEFTRRAFTNGRLDLVGAEAVADVIGAASERALRAAQAQLAGALGERVRSLRARAVALLAEIEASIDFPEEDLDCLPPGAVAEGAEAVAQGARGLAATFAVGRALREGIDVVIVGAPNVGKSSLLNALCGEERAIVAAEPGTTRDYVEARRVWDGIPVTLVDTAGERSAASELEQRGVSLGRARAAQADVIVRVRDATAAGPGAPGGEGAAEEADGRVVEAWNKVDLRAVPPGALGVSALTGAGLDELRRVVVARVVGAATEGSEAALVTTERQRALLEQAAEAAGRAAEAARARRPVELVAADVREAVARLGAITGEEVGEDLLDALFARFCIGK